LGAQVEIHPAPDLNQTPNTQTDTTWRWSTHTGSQRGDEVLTIKLQAPAEMRGIELDPGPYFTDYPRGLRIHAGACDQSTAPVIADYPVWQGSLHILHRGVPYFSPRNDVKIIFPAPVIAQCVFVHQTGKAQFDWSVSRIRIIRGN
jgi:hypothetical protein